MQKHRRTIWLGGLIRRTHIMNGTKYWGYYTYGWLGTPLRWLGLDTLI